MDPSRNPALHNAKLETVSLPNSQRQASTPDSYTGPDMPPPPAYHTIVDPTDPLPNMHNPYDPLEEEEKEQDMPEINVNATTQIRGHGNIISIAQMDSMRIANLLAILVHGGLPAQANVQAAQAHAEAQAQAQAQPQPPQEQAQAQTPPPTAAQRPSQERRELPRINININCGATVIGDRNIVGPGLGDIARHIQLAQQRQQQLQQQHQQQQQQQQQHQHHQQQKQVPVVDPKATHPQRPGFGFPVPVQTSIVTPPMSRSSSFGSDGATAMKKEDVGGVKRKAEEEQHGESATKRSR